MLTQFLNKKYIRVGLQFLLVLFIFTTLFHLLRSKPSCLESSENSVPAVLKLEKRDDGKVDFVAYFDSKILKKLWSKHSFDLELTDFRTIEMKSRFPTVKFFKHNPDLCRNNTKVEWLAYIISSAQNEEQRKFLRETWADSNLFQKPIFKVIFVIGTPSNKVLLNKIEEEMKIYNDLVMGDFEDLPQSASLKTLLGMKWVIEYCKKAKWTIKTNDISFIDLFALSSLLKQKVTSPRSILCPLWKENSMKILREPDNCGIWCVKEEDFPNRTHFPQYCAGIGYVSTPEVLEELFKASHSTPFFHVEDVYITGILSKKLEKPINFIDCENCFSNDLEKVKKQFIKKEEGKIIITQGSDKTLFKKVWGSIISGLSPQWFHQLSDTAIAKGN